MTSIQILAVAGGFCGSLGSILTAFSVASTLAELKLARKVLTDAVEDMATNEPNIFFIKNHDQRLKKAAIRDNTLLWVGVVLLVAGFVLQAVSTFMAP